MQQQTNLFSFAEQVSYFGAATVVEDENDKAQVQVCWQQDSQSCTALVNIAVARPSLLQKGANILIAGNGFNTMYVVGLLNMAPDDDKSEKVSTISGAFAQREISKQDETLCVYSDENKLLFQYNPSSKTCTVNLSHGDIALNAEQGNIRLNASKAIEINSDSLDLNSKKLNIRALVTEMVFGRLETHTDTLIENAKNVYRTVKELSQLRAGRNRTFIEETYQLNADKVLLKSENDVKVKAEKIHLG